MGFDRAFHAAATFASPPDLDDFRRRVDPTWIEAALDLTGTATVRRRRLPAEHVVWIVLGMGLFRDRTIEDVVSKLDLALPGGGTIAKSSVSQARDRLGSEPLKWLFNRCARTWATRSANSHRWRGLALYGIDGTTVRVPDSVESRARFGGQNGRNESESGAIRHPHGASDRQDQGTRRRGRATVLLMPRLDGPRRAHRGEAEECHRRRRGGGFFFTTGAAGGGPSFSTLGFNRDRYDSPSITKS